MRKFWTVLGHTYTSRLRSKSFIITTLISALLLIGVTNIQQIIGWFNHGKQEKVAVLDQTGRLYQPLSQIVKTSGKVKLVQYKKGEQAAKKAVHDGKFTGYLILSMDKSGAPQGIYKANKIAGESVPGELKQALQQVKTSIATAQLGLTPKQIAKIYKPVSFHKVALKKGAKTEKQLNQARTLVYVLLFVIYLSVIFYGSMIMMGIATEKSSRVMEILISSVSPVKQMFGKILGIALLSLTQFAVLFIVGFGSLKSQAGASAGPGQFFAALSLNSVPIATVIYAVIFFILGYLLYSTLLAMLGSLVSRVEDTQQMMMPVTFIILGGFYIALFGLNSPESPLITVTSFIPFFAPMLMFLRVGLLTVPWWQTAISIAILIATIIFFILIGARIYRGGVLMYGKTSWKNLKQAFALSKAERR